MADKKTDRKEEKREEKTKKAGEASVQAYLDISEIRDDILVMKDGSLRAILMVSSINFELKSEQEKESIILEYQNFLNSINFPIQITLRSKKLDLSGYLFRLEEKQRQETNEFIKTQIEEYIAFIKSLLEISNIMDKKIYLTVPFYASGLQTGIQKVGFLEKIGKTLNPTWAQKKKEEDFEMHKKQLLERVELVASALNGLQLRAAQLSTLDLIELFYEIYNLETAQREKLVDVEALTSDIVEQEQ